MTTLTFFLFVCAILFGCLAWAMSAPIISATEPRTITVYHNRYLSRAEAIAEAIDPDKPPDGAMLIASLAGEAYRDGIADLREALSEHSGLPPKVIDEACALAIEGIENAS